MNFIIHLVDPFNAGNSLPTIFGPMLIYKYHIIQLFCLLGCNSLDIYYVCVHSQIYESSRVVRAHHKVDVYIYVPSFYSLYAIANVLSCVCVFLCDDEHCARIHISSCFRVIHFPCLFFSWLLDQPSECFLTIIVAKSPT